MMIEILKSKIHRARVTEAELNYIGSITIDQTLMEAAGLLTGEKVSVVNINNGSRIETYVIPGKRDSGEICLNGAAARQFLRGDLVIIMAFGLVDQTEAMEIQPKVVFPDENNRIV